MKAFLFGFAIFGYGVISFLVNDASNSRTVTVPYRLTVLMLSFWVTLSSLNRRSHQAFSCKKETSSKTAGLNQIIIFSLFLFVLSYTVRILFEIVYLNSSLVNSPNEYLFRWFGICILPSLSFLFIHPNKAREYLYCSWLFLCITSVLALQIDRQKSVYFTHGRLSSAALDPISLSNIGVSLVLLSIFIFFIKKRRLPNVVNSICLLAIFIGGYISFSASSRGATIILLVCASILLIGAIRNRVSQLKISLLLLVSAACLSGASWLSIQMGSSYLNRLFLTFTHGPSIESAIDTVRTDYLSKARELIWDNLILGYGLELPDIGYPHNVVVEAFLSTGVLGGIIFTFVYVYSVYKATFLIMNDWEQWGWLGIIYIQYAILVVISGALYASDNFWYLLFTVVSFKLAKKYTYSKHQGELSCE